MNYQNNSELIDKLAAEYVLGTLRYSARKRFERWMTQSIEVRNAVNRWQNKFYPLINYISPVTPPTRVWKILSHAYFIRFI